MILAIALALTACRSSSSPAQPQPSSSAAASVELAAFVPADTAFAMFIERAMIDHPFDGLDSLDEARRDLAAAAAEPRATPADHFWGTVAEVLAPLDEGTLAQVGWMPGKSEVALYTVGLVPVVRARLDGAKFRALLDRASAASGVKPREGSWRGTPYLLFTPEPGAPNIVIAHHADQVVLAVAMKHEAVLDHLTRFTPPPPGESLEASWSIAGGADRFVYLDPTRLGALIADPAHLRVLVGDDEDVPGAACLTAIGRFLGTLPRMTSTVSSAEGRFAMRFVAELGDEVAALMRGGPLPGWPDDAKARVPTLRFAVGAPPYPLAVRSLRVTEDMVETGAACGKDEDPGFAARAIALLSPLQIVQAATWEMAVFDGVEVTMTLSLAVRDVPALWTMLVGFVPTLGNTVPAIGEVRDVPGPAPIKIGVGRDRVVGAIGAAADRRVRDYLAAPPGPRAVVLGRIDHAMMVGYREGRFRFSGEEMKDDDPEDTVAGDVTLDARVEGNRLVVETVVDLVR